MSLESNEVPGQNEFEDTQQIDKQLIHHKHFKTHGKEQVIDLDQS